MGSRFCLFFRCYSLPLPVKFIKRSTIEYFLLVITNVLFLTEPVKALIYTDIPFCLFIFLLNTPCCIYTDTFLNIRYIPFRIIIISSRFLFNICFFPSFSDILCNSCLLIGDSRKSDMITAEIVMQAINNNEI